MNQAFVKNSLGAKQIAEEVAERAQRFVPAYKRFLESQGFKGGETFEQLPQLDKKSYALAYPFEELLGDDYEECFTLFRSSGSSGHSFYWPQLKSDSRSSPAGMRILLEDVFAVHQKKTLAIMGLNLGAWMGTESISWSLKNMAINTPYPFYIFSPGSHHEEIIEMVYKMNQFVDQIILFIVPSAIAHLHLKASKLNKSFPFEKLKYMVLGEPFPESLRISLQKHAGVEEKIPFMFSIYGSADTDGLGIEFSASVALRTILYRNSALASSLGIKSPIPHFFHFIATNTFLESIDDHLCVTRWQGIPLVRYILYDRVALYNWKEFKQAVLTSEYLDLEDQPWVKVISDSSDDLPDLLAVSGRADSCLMLGGANLTEYILDAAVKCEELHDILTGLYRARIVEEENMQYLAFDLETRQGVESDAVTLDRVYHSLVQTLGQLESYFLEAWKNIYSAWDNDSSKRILRLNFIPWPGLSDATEQTIKQRGIVQ
ncbi:hypothetical protein [Nostoc sp.]|uniref:hypothetical protein n=1 Tax=Nostoc sp. TaxID=1180 RepID=UPI002FFD1D9C